MAPFRRRDAYAADVLVALDGLRRRLLAGDASLSGPEPKREAPGANGGNAGQRKAADGAQQKPRDRRRPGDESNAGADPESSGTEPGDD